MEIDYTLVFAEGWRIGSGEGAGRHLDSLVRRDGLGLPFVPGSTVRGLARDAVRQLAKALSIEICDGTLARRKDGSQGRLCGLTFEGPCPLCALAGSTHLEPRVRWGPARLRLAGAQGEVWRSAERATLAREAGVVPGLLTRAHPRTSIDPQSGRAEDDHLFTLEEAVAGLELAGSVEIEPALPRRELSLLVAALRFIREVGGQRRRGLGTCRVRIDRAALAPAFASWQDAVAALAPAAEPALPRSRAAPGAPAVAETPVPAALREPCLEIDATVVGEVVLGGQPEAGNLVSGLPYVAGSTLRGALAFLWQGDRGSEAFHRCFLSGRVRFGFLYPLDGQVAARPVPLSKHTCKLHPGPRSAFGHGFIDLLLAPAAERCQEPGCRGRLIPWTGFEGPGGLAAGNLRPSPHNRIDPETQAVREGALFAYEALAEGTRLRGYVRGESVADLEALLAGLGVAAGQPFRLRVGRRKGTLGHLECRLTGFAGRPGGVGLFPDAPPVPREWPATGLVRVDLATPAVLLDEHLGYRESLVPRDLGLDRGAFEEAVAAVQPIAGWNSLHRLPKASQWAMAAGSTFLLARPASGGDGELARLLDAAREGIGERRAEGFGVVTVRSVEAAELREARP